MEKIRKATLDDHQAIIDIYNQAVEDGLKTADTKKTSTEEGFNWMKGHLKGPHPVFVYIVDQQVAGLAKYKRLSAREAGAALH